MVPSRFFNLCFPACLQKKFTLPIPMNSTPYLQPLYVIVSPQVMYFFYLYVCFIYRLYSSRVLDKYICLYSSPLTGKTNSSLDSLFLTNLKALERSPGFTAEVYFAVLFSLMLYFDSSSTGDLPTFFSGLPTSLSGLPTFLSGLSTSLSGFWAYSVASDYIWVKHLMYLNHVVALEHSLIFLSEVWLQDINVIKGLFPVVVRIVRLFLFKTN